jgi:DNA-binding transcriptional LysR family regulator
MTQPGLSRQIVSLERELDTLLFIRDQQHVQLTPAGALLAGELPELENKFGDLLQRVKNFGYGINGKLVVGTLDGQWMEEKFTNQCLDFMKKNPNVDLIFRQGSFSELRLWLLQGEIDIAVTLKFDIENMDDVFWKVYSEDTAVFAISRYLDLSNKQVITAEDIQTQTVIVMSPDDSQAGMALSMDFFKEHHCMPKHIRYAPNLSTMLMWIEAGLGVGTVNTCSNIVMNPSVRLITEIPLGASASSCLAWKKENRNPFAFLLLDYLSKKNKKRL